MTCRICRSSILRGHSHVKQICRCWVRRSVTLVIRVGCRKLAPCHQLYQRAPSTHGPSRLSDLCILSVADSAPSSVGVAFRVELPSSKKPAHKKVKDTPPTSTLQACQA